MPTLSNSFNFIVDNQMNLDKKNEICKTLLDVESFIRTICLKKGGKYLLCYTDTKDFSEQEIFEIKYIYEQIYIQTTNDMYITDFERQMKKIATSNKCKKCIYKDKCPRIWEIVDTNLFEKSETFVRKILRLLSGNVLDIGSSTNSRYKDILINNNKISSYFGVDPDREALSLARQYFKKRREFTFINSPIENIKKEFKNIRFDFILLLRSLNHIRDTEKLLQRCTNLLNNNGRVIIVENIPFGLIRDSVIIERIKNTSSQKHHFEHYHNFRSTDVIPLLNKHGLGIITHKPVTKNTANQWIIILSK